MELNKTRASRDENLDDFWDEERFSSRLARRNRKSSEIRLKVTDPIGVKPFFSKMSLSSDLLRKGQKKQSYFLT